MDVDNLWVVKMTTGKRVWEFDVQGSKFKVSNWRLNSFTLSGVHNTSSTTGHHAESRRIQTGQGRVR